jgi:hypothetical protein
MQYMTKNNIYTVWEKRAFGFYYTKLCSVTYHSGALEAKRDPFITESHQKAIGQILGPY